MNNNNTRRHQLPPLPPATRVERPEVTVATGRHDAVVAPCVATVPPRTYVPMDRPDRDHAEGLLGQEDVRAVDAMLFALTEEVCDRTDLVRLDLDHLAGRAGVGFERAAVLVDYAELAGLVTRLPADFRWGRLSLPGFLVPGPWVRLNYTQDARDSTSAGEWAE